MGTSLYELSVGSYVQVLSAVSGFLEKGLVFCKDHDIDPNVMAETRLYPNMLPFRFQILAVCHHSIDAMEALKSGKFGPRSNAVTTDYASLQKLVADTLAGLQALKPEDVNALEGNDVLFELGNLKLPFTAANFIMSFSFPNLYFHATTAYDILRCAGVPVGKRDFVGMPRMKH